jgi:hypothetical protein
MRRVTSGTIRRSSGTKRSPTTARCLVRSATAPSRGSSARSHRGGASGRGDGCGSQLVRQRTFWGTGVSPLPYNYPLWLLRDFMNDPRRRRMGSFGGLSEGNAQVPGHAKETQDGSLLWGDDSFSDHLPRRQHRACLDRDLARHGLEPVHHPTTSSTPRPAATLRPPERGRTSPTERSRTTSIRSTRAPCSRGWRGCRSRAGATRRSSLSMAPRLLHAFRLGRPGKPQPCPLERSDDMALLGNTSRPAATSAYASSARQ